MIPPDLKTKIASLLAQGHTMRRVARETGVLLSAVKWLRRSGQVELRKPGEPTAYLVQRKGQAIILKKAGFTHAQIGQKMGGISKQRVGQLLRGLNVEVVCEQCRKPTLRPHYHHRGDVLPTIVLCPGCSLDLARLRKADKAERARTMDDRTKRFLCRNAK